MGARPKTVLNMPEFERKVAVQIATKLEQERFKRLGKLLGG